MNYKDQAGALWGTLREKNQTTQMWMYVLRIYVGKQIYMGHRKTFREIISLCLWVYWYVWVICDFCIRNKQKTPLNKTVAHSTSCQRKYYHEGFGFHLLVMEVVLESLKVFIPYNFILQRGITFKQLHTHIHIFKSLKNTSAIGFGVNMVHGHKEDASFKKCRITLLQPIYRAG